LDGSGGAIYVLSQADDVIMTDPIAISGAKVFDRPWRGFLSRSETAAKHTDAGARRLDSAVH
jgi:hypothetical protein